VLVAKGCVDTLFTSTRGVAIDSDANTDQDGRRGTQQRARSARSRPRHTLSWLAKIVGGAEYLVEDTPDARFLFIPFHFVGHPFGRAA
jgi:hypothetical protein